MYVAKFPEAVYVLHCFKKKTATTGKHDKEIASIRCKAEIASLKWGMGLCAAGIISLVIKAFF